MKLVSELWSVLDGENNGFVNIDGYKSQDPVVYEVRACSIHCRAGC